MSSFFYLNLFSASFYCAELFLNRPALQKLGKNRVKNIITSISESLAADVEWLVENEYSSGFVMAITEFKISGVKGTVSLFAGANSFIDRDVKGDRVVTGEPSTSVGLLIFSQYIYITLIFVD